MAGDRERAAAWAAWALAVAGPPALTAVLVRVGSDKRDYVFLFLALIAVAGVVRGIWPALTAAVISFPLLDYFFTVPYNTLTISDPADVVNLVVFVLTAVLVGALASRRRQAQLNAEALGRQLRNANAELVRLNQEQAEAAQSALRLARSEQQVRALEETDRLRRELLANVSHELRTPLATILAEATDKGLTTIAAQARRLEALVNDMLDMARIEGGALELQLEPVQLDDAVASAVDRLHQTSPRRRVDWDATAVQAPVLADWKRLGQILDNLLVNADRHAPGDTPVTVSAVDEGDLVALLVEDEGPGVPSELRDRVFDRFVSGGGGSGLGLAIVKGLVEAHAGSVTLEERDGSGAAFRITLPKAPAA